MSISSVTKKDRTSAALVAICALISVPLSNSAYADGPPLDQEVWKKSQSLRPQPSTDTAPVVVTVTSITYRIPRNYLTFMTIPTIKVTIPGYAVPPFQPLTEETRDCFGSILQGRQAGCASIEFRLAGPGNPRAMFENFIRGFETKGFEGKGPFGYDLYKIGPENARIEIYTKEDGKYFIKSNCFIQNNNRESGAVCTNLFLLDDGNTLEFNSYLYQLEKLPEIEAGMRQLMENFRIKETSR